MLNKRGQGLSVNMIILIVLGLAVLVVMVLGFTLGWQKVLPFLGAGNNVETIVNQCQAACTTSSVYGFCTQSRTLKTDDLPNNQKEVAGNCTYFATTADYAKYGISDCPNLCPTVTPPATE